MDQIPSSPLNSSFTKWSYDIFLSFRGEDTRNFTDHLYTALDEKESVPLETVKNFDIFIIIFSENYASSKWCLKELAEITECKAKGRKVFPVFYVDPSEVKSVWKLWNSIRKLCKRCERRQERIQVWRTALKEAGRISGYHIDKEDIICEIIGKGCVEDGLVNKESHVLMIGIHGLGGTGKTAIARALYNEFSCKFEGSSFLANIGEESKRMAYIAYKKDFLRNNWIEHKFRTKRVLIVLDDVNNEEQLKLLAEIMTDKCLLKRHKVDEYYQPEKLDDREALALLCHHALTEEQSPHCFFRLLNEVMSYCGHRPLALKVAGSFLRGKGLRQREAQVSYKELSDEEKDIFLDVACFFQGMQVLSNRCLLTISEGKLWMDNSIQKMAWEIASKQALIPGKPCRLWDHKQILRVLKRNEVPSIYTLKFIQIKRQNFSGEAFSEMDALRLLKVFLGSGCVNDKETYKLRYLHGHGYQLDSFPSNFEAEELLELNMPCSSLKQIKGMRLVLEGCRSLVKVDPSIVNLKKLSLMNLKDCKRLKSLPKRICEFEFLETLILAGCSRLEKLLGDWEERQSSVNLKASRTYRRSITPPPKLRILHLGHCKRLQGISMLPSSIEEVDAYNCTSMQTIPWKTRLGASILQRLKMNPESAFSIVLPGNTIPDRWVTHKVTESSCSDDFLGFAVCLVFAPQAERPQLNPEILCELNNFTFFYCCGEDSVESDQERGNNSSDEFLESDSADEFLTRDEFLESDQELGSNSTDEFLESDQERGRNSTDEFLESDQERGSNSTDEYLTPDEFLESDQERGNNSADHVWLAYRPHARADGCHPEEWKASFKVTDCEVKEWAICIVLKTRPPDRQVVELVQPLTGETAHSSLQNGPWLWFFSQGLWA
ncbi:hypothetical protein AAG906_020413 [Vitis piasezkii]